MICQKSCHWSLWDRVSLTVVNPSQMALTNCATFFKRSPFLSSEPFTQSTVSPGSSTRSGHPTYPKQCSCRSLKNGSKKTRTNFLVPCHPQRRCVRICQLLVMPSTSQIRQIPQIVGWCWTCPAFSRVCTELSSPTPKKLSMCLASFTVGNWLTYSQTWIGKWSNNC